MWGGSKVITRVVKRIRVIKRAGPENQSPGRRGEAGLEPCALKMKQGPDQGVQAPPEAGEDQGTGSPRGLQEERSPAHTLLLVQ